MKFVMAATALLISTGAAAQNWQHVGDWEDGSSYYVDANTVSRAGDSVRFRYEERHNRSYPLSPDRSFRPDSPIYNIVAVDAMVSCSTRSGRDMQTIYKYGDRVVTTFAEPSRESGEPAPGSALAALMDFACGRPAQAGL
jgi:hypothetical protein